MILDNFYAKVTTSFDENPKTFFIEYKYDETINNQHYYNMISELAEREIPEDYSHLKRVAVWYDELGSKRKAISEILRCAYVGKYWADNSVWHLCYTYDDFEGPGAEFELIIDYKEPDIDEIKLLIECGEL